MQNCGACNECCKEVLIQDIHGMVYDNSTVCTYLQCDKCIIYADRPSVCKQYNCGWKLDNNMPAWMRPDKSKVLINSNTKECILWEGILAEYIVPINKQISNKVMTYLVSRMKPFRFLAPKGDGYTIGAFGTKEFKKYVYSIGL